MSWRRAGAAAGVVLAVGIMALGVRAQGPIRAFYAEVARTSIVTLREGPAGQGIWGVWTGHSFAYGIESGPHQVALIDTGSDPQAGAIIAQLAARGMSQNDVALIVLTHGHDEVTAGLAQFPHARIFVGDQDRVLARRDVLPRAPVAWLQAKSMRTRRLPKCAMQTMWPGQDIALGPIEAHVVALPGHTWGSVAIVAEGIAFVGDSMAGSDDGIGLFDRNVSISPQHNAWSLARLAHHRFTTVASSHTGVHAWTDALLARWLQTQAPSPWSSAPASKD